MLKMLVLLLIKATLLITFLQFVKSQEFLSTDTGGVIREIYYPYEPNQFKNIDKIEKFPFPTSPYEIKYLPNFESEYDFFIHHLVSYKAYFITPMTGQYLFHLKCSSRCKFILYEGRTLKDEQVASSDNYESKTIAQPLTEKTRYYIKMYHEGINSTNSLGLGVTMPDNTKHKPIPGSMTYVTPDMNSHKKVFLLYYFGEFESVNALTTASVYPEQPDFVLTSLTTESEPNRAGFYGKNFGAVVITWYKVTDENISHVFEITECENKCDLMVDGNSLDGGDKDGKGEYTWNPSEKKWYKVQMFYVYSKPGKKDIAKLKLKVGQNNFAVLGEKERASSPYLNANFHRTGVVSKTSTSIEYKWYRPRIPASMNFTLQYVKLYFHELHMAPVESFTMHLNETSTKTFHNLKEYTNYRTYIYYYGLSYRIRSTDLLTRTAEAAPRKAPQSIIAVPRSSTRVDISYGEIPRDDWNGNIRGHSVQYAKVANDGVTVIGPWVRHMKNEAIIPIESLEKWTFYAFKVAGVTIADGPYTDFVIKRTHQDRPSMAPVNVNGYNTSRTSLNITWGYVPEAGRHGVITKYSLKYYKDGEYPKWIIISGRDSLHSQLTGLDWFTYYNIEVAAFTSAGQGVYSPPCRVQTDEYVPHAPPTNVTGNNISDTSIRVRFEDIADKKLIYGIPIASFVKYERIDNPTFNGEVNGTTREAILTGLKEYANYSIKVAIRTRHGYKNFSQPIYVMTDTGIPDAPPRYITSSVVSSTSLKFFWEDILEEEKNGIIIAYNFTIRKVNDTKKPWKFYTLPHKPTRTQTIEIENLEKWRSYDYAVAGITSKGCGVFSTYRQERTDEDIPEAPPDNLFAINKTKDIINITWDDVPEGFRRGVITLYTILYTESSLEVPVWRERRVRAPANEILIGRLKFYTNYTIKIAASTIKGIGNFSEEIMQATSEAPPVVIPGNFTCHNTSSSSLFCDWDKVKEGSGLTNGKVLGYNLYYSVVDCEIAELSNCNSSLEWVIVVNSPGLSANITGLERFTNYSIQVQLFNSVSNGWRSPPFYVYTEEDLPTSPPLRLEGFSGTSTSILIFWDKIPWGEKHGIIQGYRAYYRRMNEGPDAVTLREEAKKKRNLRKRRDLQLCDEYDYDEDICLDDDASYMHHVERRALYDGFYLYPEEIMVVNGTYDSMDLTDLTEYQWYTIRLTSFTSQGEGPSTHINMTCLQSVPSVGPTATVFDRYAFDEIKIEWNELTYNESRGTVFEYNVVYYAVSINGEDVIPSDYDRQSIWVDYPIHNLTVTNLQPFTKYAFEIAALTYPGVGAYANPIYGETCRCEASYTTSYQVRPPVFSMNNHADTPAGIIADIAAEAVVYCCDVCINGHGRLHVNWTVDGNFSDSKKETTTEMKMAVQDGTNIILPIQLDSSRTIYEQNPYIPIVFSPGLAIFSLRADYVDLMEKMMVETVGLLWTFVLICGLLTVSCGLIMWIVQCNPMQISRTNEEDFPEDYRHGGGAGVWWSFGTVMRVGYGDLVATGKLGRYCTFPIILIGLALPMVLVSGISTIFLTFCLDKSEGTIYAQKVATLADSYDGVYVRRWGGSLAKKSSTSEGLVSTLKDGDANRIAIDALDASYQGSTLTKNPQVVFRGIRETSSSYGVVLAGDAVKLEKCVRAYLKEHQEGVSRRTKAVLDGAQKIYAPNALKEKAKAFGTLNSQKWIMTLKVCCGIFVVFFLIGLIYECFRRRRNKVSAFAVVHTPCYRLYEVESQEMLKKFKVRCEHVIKVLELKHALQRERLRKHLRKTIKYLKPELAHKYYF